MELIDGEVVEMGPIGSRHAACVDRLAALFWQRLGKRVVVRVQNPLVLGPRTEVHPDLCLVRNRDDYYARRHPRAGDVLLVVEVAETSGEIARLVKIPLYERRS